MDLDKVKYWTELSDYDMETADAMFRTDRWLYVGYMCHQVIEKIFKAYWSSHKEEPAPYSHNLINLAQSCGLGQLLDNLRPGTRLINKPSENRSPRKSVKRFSLKQRRYSNG